ncbi:MAG: hypothetical protein P4L83_22970, partial [Nevskia sp.]|nr:hypothetical protein [Nevskia sp.]
MTSLVKRKRMRSSTARLFWQQHLDACRASPHTTWRCCSTASISPGSSAYRRFMRRQRYEMSMVEEKTSQNRSAF